MSRIIRWIVTAIFIIILLPFITANIQKFLASKQYDEFLLNWWPNMLDLRYLLESRWIWWIWTALIFSGGVTTGLWLVRLFPEKGGVAPKPFFGFLSLEILSHKNGSRVKYEETVRGVISIANYPVQVFVYAGDDMWHAQRDAIVTEYDWEVKCVFGDPGSPPGSPYRIAAISRARKIEGKIAKLPPDPQSAIVNVVRS